MSWLRTKRSNRHLSVFRHPFGGLLCVRWGGRSLVFAALSVFFLSVFSPPLGALGPDDRPYDQKLERLSEILGAVHYLRELCGAEEGQMWRNQMRDLIDSEGTSALRRVKFVKSFNKGYRGYRRTYRNCTRSAKVAIKRFMAEGAKVSQQLLDKNK